MVSSGFGDSTTTAATGRLPLPMLTRTNYAVWAMRMKYLLRTNGMWGAVDPKKACRASSDDEPALLGMEMPRLGV